jgi:hypothetical protein
MWLGMQTGVMMRCITAAVMALIPRHKIAPALFGSSANCVVSTWVATSKVAGVRTCHC